MLFSRAIDYAMRRGLICFGGWELGTLKSTDGVVVW
jgi:hypothetical protein